MATSSSTEEEFAVVEELTPDDKDRLRQMLARTSTDINDEWFALQDWGLV